MATLVALLRGINVGGRRAVRMADLRACLTDAGYDRVSTHIQSGNVLFTDPGRSPERVAAELSSRIEERFGFAVPVVVRTEAELAAVLERNPFPRADTAFLHVAFLPEEPDPAVVVDAAGERFAPEELAVVGREVYLHLPGGMGRAKLPPAIPVLRRGATVRNWRTVTKLVQLARAAG